MDLTLTCALAKHRLHQYVDFISKDRVEWHGELPLYSMAYDLMFYSLEEIFNFCQVISVSIDRLCLHLCYPVYLDAIHIEELWPTKYIVDGKIPYHIVCMIDNLNASLAQCDPVGHNVTEVGVII